MAKFNATELRDLGRLIGEYQKSISDQTEITNWLDKEVRGNLYIVPAGKTGLKLFVTTEQIDGWIANVSQATKMIEIQIDRIFTEARDRESLAEQVRGR